MDKAQKDGVGALTWVEELEFFRSWNVLELPNDLKECLEFLFLLWSLLFLIGRKWMFWQARDEPQAGLWGAKLASEPWLGHTGIPVFLTHECQTKLL